MTRKTCNEITELLVDYADEELSSVEANIVQEHVSECKQCRNTLDALRRSIGIANVIWEDGLSEISSFEIPVDRKVKKNSWIKYAAIAASVLIAISSLMMWIPNTQPQAKEAAVAMSEIEQRITDAGNAAQLFASAELLTEYSRCQSIVRKQYNYIIERYPETMSAGYAKLKINILERKM
ncbi:MAG: hypothetical protein DRP56_06290 [Planctomycetota bacterium]|nr:MAG: hypothetical protein DRP56_06290 [Planctomycetota bacterium]